MPVEGQWERARTPLRRRERGVLVAAALLAVVVVALAGLVLARRGTHAPRTACVVVDVPSTMGGARLRQCGAAARTFCRTQGPKNRAIADACRAQGFAVPIR